MWRNQSNAYKQAWPEIFERWLGPLPQKVGAGALAQLGGRLAVRETVQQAKCRSSMAQAAMVIIC